LWCSVLATVPPIKIKWGLRTAVAGESHIIHGIFHSGWRWESAESRDGDIIVDKVYGNIEEHCNVTGEL